LREVVYIVAKQIHADEEVLSHLPYPICNRQEEYERDKRSHKSVDDAHRNERTLYVRSRCADKTHDAYLLASNVDSEADCVKGNEYREDDEGNGNGSTELVGRAYDG